MAKIYGLFGSMTGKLADTVMSVRNGEQLARKYQPVVYNPSTPAQVAQRAKMKLLSQLSAVMAPVIAIPREGAVSARNLFTKVNFGLTSYATDNATITLADIQLTRSVVAMPTITAQRVENTLAIFVNVPAGETLDVDGVVYCVFAKQADNKLRFLTSEVVTIPGPSGDYTASLEGTYGDAIVVFAYAYRHNTESARAIFGNLTALTAETIAKLVVTRAVSKNDITFTETRGTELAALPAHSVGDENRKKK